MEIDPDLLLYLAGQHDQVGDDTRKWAEPPTEWLSTFLDTYGTIAHPVHQALLRYYDARQRAGNQHADDHYAVAKALRDSAAAYRDADQQGASQIGKAGDGFGQNGHAGPTSTGPTGPTGATGSDGPTSFARTANFVSFGGPEWIQPSGAGLNTSATVGTSATSGTTAIVKHACTLKNLHAVVLDNSGVTMTFTVQYLSSPSSFGAFSDGPSCSISNSGSCDSVPATEAAIGNNSLITFKQSWSGTTAATTRLMVSVDCL